MSSKMKEGTENQEPETTCAVYALHGEYLAQNRIPQPVLEDVLQQR